MDDKLILTGSGAQFGSEAPSTLAPSAGRLPVREEDVVVLTSDGQADAVVQQPDSPGQWPGVLVWPDIIGLRPMFREMGRRLAAMGYVVLTPNPFYRVKRAPVVGTSFSFADAKDREAIFALGATLDHELIERDSLTYIRFLDARPGIARNRKIGVHGYCLGGSFAFHSAAAVPGRVGAVASFHGANLVTGSAASPHVRVAGTTADYLVEIARNDDAADPDAKLKLASAFRQSKLSARIDVCAANHGWCVADSTAYDRAQAEKAWVRLMGLYGFALA